jgi:DNA-directed RNA polymerase I, II, and III subunit RPABC5
MLIPIRCFTCGKVLADKWNPFVEIVKNERGGGELNLNNNIELEYLDTKSPEATKSIEGDILDKLNITRYCCRRMMLGTVNIVSDI